MDNVQTILSQARDAMTVKRVFGDPIERDGATIIPVAHVFGGGGGGKTAPVQRDGENGQTEEQGASTGAGFGLAASPAGIYVIKDGNVTWQPAINVNRVIMGGQIVAVIVSMMVFIVLRARQRRDERRAGA